MNDEEFKPLKPTLEQESQPSPLPSETRQQSPPSQPETCNLPSSSSSEVPGTSSEDVPRFVFPKPEPFSLSRFRSQAIAAAKAITEGRGSSLPSLTAESSPVSEQKISVAKRIDSLKERILASKFSSILKKKFGNPLAGEKTSSTDRKTNFLEDLAKMVPFEIPVNILDGKKIPSSTSTGLRHRQHTPESNDGPPEMLDKKFTGDVLGTSSGLRHREPIPASKDAPPKIPGFCAAEASRGLRDSQPSLASQNSDSGEDYYVPESVIRELEDAMEDWTPLKSSVQPSVSTSKNKADPILGEDSLTPELVECALAHALDGSSDVTPQESSEGSSEGSPFEELENPFRIN